MIKVIRVQEQLAREQNKNKVLERKLLQAQANIDYIAIMSDIDIDNEQEATNEQEL